MYRFITMIAVFIVVSISFPKLLIAEDTFPKNWCDYQDYKCLVQRYSKEYNVSARTMEKIIACESGWNPIAHNSKGEDSWGLVQINLKAHSDISVEQATDPEFAVQFLARHLNQGKSKMWSCARITGVS